MAINNGRLTNPQTSDLPEADRAIADGTLSVIQFDSPPNDPETLHQVNLLCAKFGTELQVRFYGFYRSKFDARIVEQLPDIVSLSIDCLQSIEFEDSLANLPLLKKLTFGVFEFDRPNLLQIFDLERLTDLTLIENRKRNFDLSLLERCSSLETLFVNSHWKGVEIISSLPKLSSVTLSGFPNRSSLEFLNELRTLKQLRLLLGSRDSIAEFSHQSLERLSVCWVRGLCEIGPLSRFPKLFEFSLEDQLRLNRIDVSNSPLQRLRLVNCKTLLEIQGLETLASLRELLVSRTALNLEELRDRNWTQSLETLGLYSTSRKWNEATQEALARKGYQKSGKPWLWT